jgi:hypothetical protein
MIKFNLSDSNVWVRQNIANMKWNLLFRALPLAAIAFSCGVFGVSLNIFLSGN